MKNDDKASISLKKIICISILFVFIMTAAVVAGNVKLNNVKIILASGYEMNVLTSKTKIADILDDNHIILLEDEKVSPDLESEAIRITIQLKFLKLQMKKLKPLKL